MNKTSQKENQQYPVFMVELNMSSPNQEKIPGVSCFSKELRHKISAIRMQFWHSVSQNTLNVYGIRLCTEEQQKKIIELVKESDKNLNELDDSLYATAKFTPIKFSVYRRGKMYKAVASAIRHRVLNDVIERLEVRGGQLTEQTKQTVQREIQRLKSVNVLNDPKIEKQLKKISKKIATENIEDVRTELQHELKPYLYIG